MCTLPRKASTIKSTTIPTMIAIWAGSGNTGNQSNIRPPIMRYADCALNEKVEVVQPYFCQ